MLRFPMSARRPSPLSTTRRRAGRPGWRDAIPISSPAGIEQLPRFSPDGTAIAFSANYDGTTTCMKWTWPAAYRGAHVHAPGRGCLGLYATAKCCSRSRWPGLSPGEPVTIDPAQGRLPRRCRCDGRVRHNQCRWQCWRSTRSPMSGHRARYQGGSTATLAVNLQTSESRQMTNFPGTDDLPLWHGSRLYFISDSGEDNRRNIHVIHGQRPAPPGNALDNFDVKLAGHGPATSCSSRAGA